MKLLIVLSLALALNCQSSYGEFTGNLLQAISETFGNIQGNLGVANNYFTQSYDIGNNIFGALNLPSPISGYPGDAGNYFGLTSNYINQFGQNIGNLGNFGTLPSDFQNFYFNDATTYQPIIDGVFDYYNNQRNNYNSLIATG